MKTLFTPLIVSILLLGCALSPKKGAEEKPALNNIAVISMMDAPLSPLSNSDQVIIAEMLNLLKKSERSSFALQVEKNMVTTERARALALKDVYLGNRYQTLEKYFLDQARLQRADFLIIVHPSPHDRFPDYTPGYGLYCVSVTGSQMEMQGYFMMASELWDVKKQQVVSRVQLSPTELNFNTQQKCKETTISKDLARSYDEDFTKLAKKSSALILGDLLK